MADFKKDVPPRGVPRRRRNWRAIILTICAMVCGTVFISCCALAVIVASVLSGIGTALEGIGAFFNTLIGGYIAAVLLSGAGGLILLLACLIERCWNCCCTCSSICASSSFWKSQCRGCKCSDCSEPDENLDANCFGRVAA